MSLTLQPTNSNLCGHCCLAALLNISLSKAIELIGHQRGTITKELTKHLLASKTILGKPTTKSLCIVRPIGMACKGNWHWVVWVANRIYDPCIGKLIHEKDWERITNLKISSHIKIN